MRIIKSLLVLPVLACALAFPTGCKTVTAKTPTAALAPGANSQFDQDSYKALMVAQASINSLRDSVSTDANLAKYKPAINQAISDYNLAQVAWQTYHAAATVANQQAVTESLNKVNSDVSEIQKAVQ